MIPEPFKIKEGVRRYFEEECKKAGVDVMFTPILMGFEVHILGEIEIDEFVQIVARVGYQAAIDDACFRITKEGSEALRG